MEIKIKNQKSKLINIPINSEAHRIEQIKNEIASCQTQTEFCEVEIWDMWDDLESRQ